MCFIVLFWNLTMAQYHRLSFPYLLHLWRITHLFHLWLFLLPELSLLMVKRSIRFWFNGKDCLLKTRLGKIRANCKLLTTLRTRLVLMGGMMIRTTMTLILLSPTLLLNLIMLDHHGPIALGSLHLNWKITLFTNKVSIIAISLHYSNHSYSYAFGYALTEVTICISFI